MVSALEKAPTILTRRGAELLTAKITRSLDRASRLLVQAYHGRAWEALGFDTWEAYTAAHWGEVAGIKLERPDRDALIVALTLDGRGRKQVADHLGTSLGTVQGVLEREGVIDLTAKRAAREARRAAEQVDAPPAPEPPPAVSKRDRAVQLVAEQGARGLTALELAEVTGWTGGSSTGTMSDLARQQRVTRTSEYRRGYAAYVVHNAIASP